jgi:hypothetical protein
MMTNSASPDGNPVSLFCGRKSFKSFEMLGNCAIREGNQPLPERISLLAIHGKGSAMLYLVFVGARCGF